MIDIVPSPETASITSAVLSLGTVAKIIYSDLRRSAWKKYVNDRFEDIDDRLDDLKSKQADQDTRQLAYMLEVEKTYARETAVQESMKVLTNAMDNLRRELKDEMREISSDIKGLIKEVAEKS